MNIVQKKNILFINRFFLQDVDFAMMDSIIAMNLLEILIVVAVVQEIGLV
jgi:hypothetical protein